MILVKKSKYNNSISLSDEEVARLELGQYDELQFTTDDFSVTMDISCVGQPTRIPLTDSDGDFKGYSSYSVAKIKLPPGQYNGIKIYSQEEINNMFTN